MYTYSREVLRELFRLPKNVYYNRNFRNFGCFSYRLSRYGWAFGLDLFQRTFQRNEPSPKTPATPPHPTALPRNGLGFGLADLFQRTFQPSRAGKPKTPALRSAQPLTCPSLRLTAASGWAPPPPPTAPLRSAPLRSDE